MEEKSKGKKILEILQEKYKIESAQDLPNWIYVPVCSNTIFISPLGNLLNFSSKEVCQEKCVSCQKYSQKIKLSKNTKFSNSN